MKHTRAFVGAKKTGSHLYERFPSRFDFFAAVLCLPA